MLHDPMFPQAKTSKPKKVNQPNRLENDPKPPKPISFEAPRSNSTSIATRAYEGAYSINTSKNYDELKRKSASNTQQTGSGSRSSSRSETPNRIRAQEEGHPSSPTRFRGTPNQDFPVEETESLPRSEILQEMGLESQYNVRAMSSVRSPSRGSTTATPIQHPDDVRSGTPITARPVQEPGDNPIKFDWIQVQEKDDNSAVEAFMLVSVLQARNLPAMDHNNSTNAFVEIYFNGEAYRADTVKEDLHPIWNSHYLFRMPPKSERSEMVIQIVVFAEGKAFLAGDDYIGQIQVQLPRSLTPNHLHCNWTPLCTGDVKRRNPSALERMLRKRTSKDLEDLPEGGLGEIKVAWIVLDLTTISDALSSERTHNMRLEDDLELLRKKMASTDQLRQKSEEALQIVNRMKDDMNQMKQTQEADKVFFKQQNNELCRRLGASMIVRHIQKSPRSSSAALKMRMAFVKWNYMCRLCHDQDEDAKLMGMFILRGVLSRVIAVQSSLAFHHWCSCIKLSSEKYTSLNASRLSTYTQKESKIPKKHHPDPKKRESSSSVGSNFSLEHTTSSKAGTKSPDSDSISVGSNKRFVPGPKKTAAAPVLGRRSVSTESNTKIHSSASKIHRRTMSGTEAAAARASGLTPTDHFQSRVTKGYGRRSSSLASSSEKPSLDFSQEEIERLIASFDSDEDPEILAESRERCWQKVRGFALGQIKPTLEMEQQNLSVAVRVRPFNVTELQSNAHSIVQIQDNQISVMKPNASSGSSELHRFAFDHCFDSQYSTDTSFSTGKASQQRVFENIGVDLLVNAFMGFNATLFAYGQTGSGKSHSMMGSEGQPGVIMRLADHLFNFIRRGETESLEVNKYHVEVSCLEIYNEHVRDLGYSSTQAALRVREAPGVGVFVDGLSSRVISTIGEMHATLEDAIESRVIGATAMNAVSSRSHLILTIKFSQKLWNPQTNLTMERMSKINLIDLAGSERSGKTLARGDQMKEGAQINKSLSTLGRVIQALSKSDAGCENAHVPFRDSLLTWLLKESLGGNAKTTMLACLSPSTVNFEESLSTLRYANSAKQIKTRPIVNEDPTARLINDLKAEIESLKYQLLETRQNLSGLDNSSYSAREADQEENSEASEAHFEKLDQLMTIQAQMEQAQLSWEQKKYMEEQVSSCRKKCRRRSLEQDWSPYLVNVHEDPLVSGRLRYFLPPGNITVGRGGDMSDVVDLQFDDPGIEPVHCFFFNAQDKNEMKVSVSPHPKAEVFVNGAQIQETPVTELYHGDRIVLGNLRILFIMIIPPSSGHPHSPRSVNDFLTWQKGIYTFKQVVRELHSGHGRDRDTSGKGLLSSNGKARARAESKEQFSLIHQLSDSSIEVPRDDDILKGFVQIEQANEVARILHQPVRFQLKLVQDAGKGSSNSSISGAGNKHSNLWHKHQLQFWCVWNNQNDPKCDITSPVEVMDSSGTCCNGFPVFIMEDIECFEEFVSNITSLYQLVSKLIKQTGENLHTTFFNKIFESVDKGGVIGSMKLKHALSTLGLEVPSEEIWEIFRIYDRNRNGTLQREEFIHFLEDHMSTLFEACVPMPQRLQLETIRKVWAPKHQDVYALIEKEEAKHYGKHAKNKMRKVGSMPPVNLGALVGRSNRSRESPQKHQSISRAETPVKYSHDSPYRYSPAQTFRPSHLLDANITNRESVLAMVSDSETFSTDDESGYFEMRSAKK